MTPLAPTRPRLAEALACVTAQSAAWWAQPYIAQCALHFSGRAVAFAPPGTYRFGGWKRADQADPVLTITDPREAWEALATRGVIPLDACEDPRRAFHDGGEWCRRWHEGPNANPHHDECFAPHPPTVAACVALASDWAGVVTAEAIARELTGRDRVVWRVVPRAEVARTDAPDASLLRDVYALGYALEAGGDGVATLLCPALDDGAPAGAEED